MVEPNEPAGPCSSEPDAVAAGRDENANSQSDGPEISQLVSEHYRSVYRYAFRLTGSQADAEDVTQQTFLVAQHKLHQVREVEKVDRWLFAVVRSCFLKSIRRQRPTSAGAVELNVDEIPDHRIGDVDVDQELLQAAIDDLPEKLKLVVVMFYFERLSYKEMAATLDISIGTVMSRLSRAKGRLRQRLIAREGPTAVGQHPSAVALTKS